MKRRGGGAAAAAWIDVNEILSSSLPPSIPRCSFLRDAEEQKRIIQESDGHKNRNFGVQLSRAHSPRPSTRECDVCEQIGAQFLEKIGERGKGMPRNGAHEALHISDPRWPHLIVSIPRAQWSNKAPLNRYWSCWTWSPDLARSSPNGRHKNTPLSLSRCLSFFSRFPRWWQ